MILLKHILLGSLLIAIGAWLIYDTYKNDEDLRKSKVLSFHYWKGYVAGIALIAMGIAEMCGYLKW